MQSIIDFVIILISTWNLNIQSHSWVTLVNFDILESNIFQHWFCVLKKKEQWNVIPWFLFKLKWHIKSLKSIIPVLLAMGQKRFFSLSVVNLRMNMFFLVWTRTNSKPSYINQFQSYKGNKNRYSLLWDDLFHTFLKFVCILHMFALINL